MDVHPPKNGIFIGIDPYPYDWQIQDIQVASERVLGVWEMAGLAWRLLGIVKMLWFVVLIPTFFQAVTKKDGKG